MFILFLLVLLIFIIVLLFAIYKAVKWTLKEKIRLKWAVSILTTLVLAIVIKKVFFTRMEFIQSNVYSNLYIVENPVKDKDELKTAIISKIKEHLKTNHKQTKKLSYSNETECIYFYEDGGMTFGFLGEAGTSYFLDHEEDLGGFVSEELGMYQQYLMAEFYYETFSNELNSICGEFSFFYEGEFVKTDTLVIKID
ncbi:hypothetical protein KK2020170_18150 [Flavobacterium okayamense]|uniref:DUF306 domain-containing protein n=2 Tax=Flavobacterium okayamense TaxID=2830782 RepID=A0ABN6HZY9_9FLAO|nr:hypothetical protein KK2020170_18150 [Flavobacterium okayamense]